MLRPSLKHTDTARKPSAAIAARRIAVLYAVVGGLWIVVSDLVLNQVAETQFAGDLGEVAKGLFFVLLTAFVLCRLLRKELERREEVTQEAQLYQHLTESSHDAIFMLDPQDQFRIVPTQRNHRVQRRTRIVHRQHHACGARAA